MNEKPTIKIYYTDFWPGFDPYSTKNYFTKLLSLKYTVEIHKENPDLLIYSTYGYSFQMYKCKKVFWTNEIKLPYGDYSLGLSYSYTEDENHLRLPYYSYVSLESEDFHKFYPIKNKDRRLNFCSLITDNIAESYGSQYEFEFAKMLAKHKKILSSGKAERNTNYPELDPFLDKLSPRNRFQQILEKEKPNFVICFESQSIDGYTSEKIYDVLMSGAVPLYWGNNSIYKDFNPDAILDISKFQSLNAAVDYIKFLDKYPNRYTKIQEQPNLLDENKIYFNHTRILDKLVELINAREGYFVNQTVKQLEVNRVKINEDSINVPINQLNYSNIITPNQYFDEIYCLNLNRRPDRWIALQKKLIREEIFVNRVEAIDGKSREIINQWKNKRTRISSTSFAIKLSHLKIFNNAIARNLDKILILEDDILFHKDFKTRFDTEVRNLPSNWNMWYLGYGYYEPDHIVNVNDHFRYASNTDCFHALALRVDFIKKIKLMIENDNSEQIDVFVRKNLQPNVENNIYMSVNKLIIQDSGFSDNHQIMVEEGYDKEIYI